MEWKLENDSLYRKFCFQDFRQAFAFMSQVAEIAERDQHHPRWTNEWNQVEIWLQTHDAGHKVTEKDYRLAQSIDAIWENSGGKYSPENRV